MDASEGSLASVSRPPEGVTPAPSPPGDRAARRGRRWLLLGLFALPAVLFLAAPWTAQQKAYALCSGICAQQVTHTLEIGGGLLPLDARCTGIYGGFLITALYLLALGRGRAIGAPPIRYLVMAGVLVLLMGLDGFNSLLKDVRIWHPYEPDNRLRLITGLGAGFGVAILLMPVAASVLWKNGVLRPVIRNAAELLGLAALFGAYYLTLQLRPDWLLAPVALFLSAAVLAVFGTLNLIVTASAIWSDGPRAVRVGDLLVPAGLAFLLATLELGLFALFRFLLERVSGVDMRTYLS
jgi:uncharacterized membrane protein